MTGIHVMESLPWFAWVGIVAIVCGSLNGLVASWTRHRERMEMIRQGMNPDALDQKPSPRHEL